MANKSLFGNASPGPYQKPADTVNEAGGQAYSLDAESALAQIACTGTLNNTFYATAESQLDKVLELCEKVPPRFVRKCAVYARTHATMKDLPVALTAWLHGKGHLEEFKIAAASILTYGKSIRTFVQMVRSGKFGRKSLGRSGRNVIARWLRSMEPSKLLRQSYGADPSMGDVIRLAHPVPENQHQQALWSWLCGLDPYRVLGLPFGCTDEDKIHEAVLKAGASKNWVMMHASQIRTGHYLEHLPSEVVDYEKWLADPTHTDSFALPRMPFAYLETHIKSTRHWQFLSLASGYNFLRMRLNSLGKHGCFKSKQYIDEVTKVLGDRAMVLRSKVNPHELFMTYLATAGSDVPARVRDALHDAVDYATENVPVPQGNVLIAVDVSGSMTTEPLTGQRAGATSRMMCNQAAGLIASALLRGNKQAHCVGFDTELHLNLGMTSRDSVFTNAERISKIGGGGTDTSLAFKAGLIAAKAGDLDTLIVISDNQSWVPSAMYGIPACARLWSEIKSLRPNARLVLIDLQPYTTTQVNDQKDVLNVGGWNAAAFDVVAKFLNGQASNWVTVINGMPDEAQKPEESEYTTTESVAETDPV